MFEDLLQHVCDFLTAHRESLPFAAAILSVLVFECFRVTFFSGPQAPLSMLAQQLLQLLNNPERAKSWGVTYKQNLRYSGRNADTTGIQFGYLGRIEIDINGEYVDRYLTRAERKLIRRAALERLKLCQARHNQQKRLTAELTLKSQNDAV